MVAEANEDKRNEHFDILKEWGFEVHYVDDGASALALAYYLQPTLIVLTTGLPRIEEVEVTTYLKGNPETQHIPILLATETPENYDSALLVDEVVALPLKKNQFNKTLKKAG